MTVVEDGESVGLLPRRAFAHLVEAAATESRRPPGSAPTTSR